MPRYPVRELIAQPAHRLARAPQDGEEGRRDGEALARLAAQGLEAGQRRREAGGPDCRGGWWRCCQQQCARRRWEEGPCRSQHAIGKKIMVKHGRSRGTSRAPRASRLPVPPRPPSDDRLRTPSHAHRWCSSAGSMRSADAPRQPLRCSGRRRRWWALQLVPERQCLATGHTLDARRGRARVAARRRSLPSHVPVREQLGARHSRAPFSTT